MGMIAKLRHRVGYVWYWRVRYWWYDTPGGRRARAFGVCLLALALIEQMIQRSVKALQPAPAHQPREAIIWIVVWLIVALIVGLAVALTAKTPHQAPPDQAANTPSTQDGQNVKHHFGTCRVKDEFMLAFRVVGKEPIYTSGGK